MKDAERLEVLLAFVCSDDRVWKTLKEAERYTRAADQKRIAASAMSLLLPERSGNGSG
jgi:hypothetical protein